MGCALENPIGQVLKNITSIDDDLPIQRVNRTPSAIALKKFEPSLGGFSQQLDEIDILVGCGSHCARLCVCWHRRIVNNP